MWAKIKVLGVFLKEDHESAIRFTDSIFSYLVTQTSLKQLLFNLILVYTRGFEPFGAEHKLEPARCPASSTTIKAPSDAPTSQTPKASSHRGSPNRTEREPVVSPSRPPGPPKTADSRNAAT